MMKYLYLKLFVLISLLTHVTEATPRIAKPGCKATCGNVTIPYPFGVGPKCYHDPWFDIECTDDNKFKLKALNWSVDFQIGPEYANPTGRQIIWSGERALTMDFQCVGYCGDAHNNPAGRGPVHSTDLRKSPFLYSSNRNVLLVVGCGGDVVLRNSDSQPLTGCAQICRNVSEMFEIKHCYGVGCCQTTLPYSLDYFWLDFMVTRSKTCSRPTYAILVDKSWIADKVISPEFSQLECPVPVILEWTVPNLPVQSPSYANSTCEYKKSSKNGGSRGYECRCIADYYEGNPYLPHGCQVVRECQQCAQDCVNFGNNTFGCWGDTNQELAKGNIFKEKAGLVLGLGLGLSTIMLLILFATVWMYKQMKRRRKIQLKTHYFERNGGMILKSQLSSEDSNIDKARIFTSNELEKATDRFNTNRILGYGGQAIVYKGMLTDGKIVAIKKFKLANESQLDDFINEVMLLSQINHRNVVKLLGCCLETEVPMLIYEYVPNGTLSQQFGSPNEDFPFTWEIRLQIATDVANALAYLHSSSSLPIFHRDIKASNILLDNKYRAKLSDFGISKSIAIDQTHVTTRVIGTFGYLDPEYFQSRQFTDKSDVYSFGVVLVELLTGKMADRSAKDDRGLVQWFITHVETSFFYDILDAQVIKGGKEDIHAVCELARRCLMLDGRMRPTMKEVEAILQTVRSSQGGKLNVSAITNTQSSLANIDSPKLNRRVTS